MIYWINSVAWILRHGCRAWELRPASPENDPRDRRSRRYASHQPWRGVVVCDVSHIRYVNRGTGAVSATKTRALVGWRRGQSDAGRNILRPPDSDASPQQQLHSFKPFSYVFAKRPVAYSILIIGLVKTSIRIISYSKMSANISYSIPDA